MAGRPVTAKSLMMQSLFYLMLPNKRKWLNHSVIIKPPKCAISKQIYVKCIFVCPLVVESLTSQIIVAFIFYNYMISNTQKNRKIAIARLSANKTSSLDVISLLFTKQGNKLQPPPHLTTDSGNKRYILTIIDTVSVPNSCKTWYASCMWFPTISNKVYSCEGQFRNIAAFE